MQENNSGCFSEHTVHTVLKYVRVFNQANILAINTNSWHILRKIFTNLKQAIFGWTESYVKACTIM